MNFSILLYTKNRLLGFPKCGRQKSVVISHDVPLYYYKNNRIGEIDFLAEIDGKVIPIEVKSGKVYKSHSALNHLLDSEEYGICKAYVFSNYNVSELDKRL